MKNTEIGRHVTKLRKHSSSEVRRLVKIVIRSVQNKKKISQEFQKQYYCNCISDCRKWKETVDEWVKQNTPIEEEEVATEFNGKNITRFCSLNVV